MKIIWDWSIDSELNRIMQACRNTGNGFYSLNHFYPLPYSKNGTYDSTGIYIPDLPYSQLSRFWQSTSQLDDHHLPLQVPVSISKFIHPYLERMDLEMPDTKSLQSEFEAIVPKVITFLHSTFPHIMVPTHITIYPTYFGSAGSFNWITKDGEIVIYHRIDQDICALIECLLTSIMRPQAVSTHSATWSETEFLVDFLMTSSVLSELLPTTSSFKPTLASTRSNHDVLAKLSLQFLQKIGAPLSSTKTFTSKNGTIYYGEKPLNTLSNRESKVLEKLISISPSPVSIDEIGDLIFSNDEKFSLSAINKTIERLRKKLATLGISSSYLATASGIGYYLKN